MRNSGIFTVTFPVYRIKISITHCDNLENISKKYVEKMCNLKNISIIFSKAYSKLTHLNFILSLLILELQCTFWITIGNISNSLILKSYARYVYRLCLKRILTNLFIIFPLLFPTSHISHLRSTGPLKGLFPFRVRGLRFDLIPRYTSVTGLVWFKH